MGKCGKCSHKDNILCLQIPLPFVGEKCEDNGGSEAKNNDHNDNNPLDWPGMEHSSLVVLFLANISNEDVLGKKCFSR